MRDTVSDQRTFMVRMSHRSSVRMIINFAQAQAGWLACVLSAAADQAWMGVAAASILIGVHLLLIYERTSEAVLVLAAGLVGAATDTLLAQLGFLRFEAGVAPLWMIALWMLFATTLRWSLAWMRTHLVIAALVGSIGGPAAYAAGARLGALEIADSWTSYAAIGIAWALALPILVFIAHRGHVSFTGRGPDARKSHA